LLVHDHVREDAHLLFGFASDKERQMFGLLMGISGIGPKLALSALSGLTVRELTAAVVEGDVRRLNWISGVGKKTAERMVVELRDKISEADALEAVAGPEGGGTAGTPVLRDAMSALVALGYKQDDARKMVQRVTKAGADDRMVEDIIREALSR
jgi:Holliday junction DNA helicase RuvA